MNYIEKIKYIILYIIYFIKNCNKIYICKKQCGFDFQGLSIEFETVVTRFVLCLRCLRC